MSKKKGLSLDEKRTRLLEIFHEKEEFFQLKELEKLGPKEKGIISQSVKDVLQSLVDDGKVDSEKIGTSIYYWSFLNKASNNIECKLEKAKKDLKDATLELKQNNLSLEKVRIGREDSGMRQDTLKEVETMKREIEILNKELEKYKDSDPETLKSIENIGQSAKEAANRWTDNIFSMKSWCKRKFNMEENMLNKHFSIPEEMDYIE